MLEISSNSVLVPFLSFPKPVLEFIRFSRLLATAVFRSINDWLTWIWQVFLWKGHFVEKMCCKVVSSWNEQPKRETCSPDCEVSHEGWISLALWQERHLSWSISALIKRQPVCKSPSLPHTRIEPNITRLHRLFQISCTICLRFGASDHIGSW